MISANGIAQFGASGLLPLRGVDMASPSSPPSPRLRFFVVPNAKLFWYNVGGAGGGGGGGGAGGAGTTDAAVLRTKGLSGGSLG